MTTKVTRRAAIRLGATGLISIPIAALGLRETARAADLPTLEENDPAAKALAYTKDATTLDPAKFPSYKAGQTCATCRQYKGDANSGQCALFPNKRLSAAGWCKVWSAK